jgi:hypothetical protein
VLDLSGRLHFTLARIDDLFSEIRASASQGDYSAPACGDTEVDGESAWEWPVSTNIVEKLRRQIS